MKLALAVVLMLPSLAIAQVQMGQTVGPRIAGDSAPTILRAGRTSEQITSPAHGDYHEMTRLGLMNTLESGSITVATTDTSKMTLQAAATGSPTNTNGARFLVGFFNPSTSGKAAVIINGHVSTVSGTPNGPAMYEYICGVNLINATAGTIKNGYVNLAGSSSMQPMVQTALYATGFPTTALTELYPVGGVGNVAVGAGVQTVNDDVKGSIIVPPGCAFGIAASLIGTSHVLYAGLKWEEVAWSSVSQ